MSTVQTPQFDKMLQALVARRGSDLHLNVGAKPTIVCDGLLVPLETKVLTPEDMANIRRAAITVEARDQELNKKGSTDFALDFSEGSRFRVQVCRAGGNIKITARRLPNQLLTPEQIGLPPQFVALSDRARGLLVVTGPTGSGKTTTLAALIHRLLQKGGRHIVMVEHPTEYKFEHGKGLVTQREVGIDVLSFQTGLEDALRQAPDVIVVGEMRDIHTMRAAISAAETGHLVIATLHTSSAGRTVNRIIDSFPAEQQAEVRSQLSLSLIGVLCQQLVPLKAGSGRAAAFELLIVTNAIANQIREGKTERIDSTIQTGGKEGMKLLDDDLLRLVREDRISIETALSRANNPQDVATRYRAGA